MKRSLAFLLSATLTISFVLAQGTDELVNEPLPDQDRVVAKVGAERKLFNGEAMGDWDGNPELWSVKDGAIFGQTSAEKPLKRNSFLVWKGGTVSDFELTLKYRIIDGNSGIQFRSRQTEKGPQGPVVQGYQADFEAGNTYSGILYEEGGRGILAKRGEKVTISSQEKPAGDDKAKDFKIEVTGEVGKSDEIQAGIKSKDWNEMKVIAKGNHIQEFINGKQTVDVTDNDAKHAAKEGILALQIHAGPPMTVEFKDIVLKALK